MDPAMMQGGGAPMPMDPSMAQGGGMPMDPSMMQGGGAPAPMDPSMMQGGGAPMPPMDPAAQGGGEQITVGQLYPEELIGLIQEAMSGVEAPADTELPADEMEERGDKKGPTNNEVLDRLDALEGMVSELLTMLGGGAPMDQMSAEMANVPLGPSIGGAEGGPGTAGGMDLGVLGGAPVAEEAMGQNPMEVQASVKKASKRPTTKNSIRSHILSKTVKLPK
jgi:hypothetical protein